MYDVIEITWVNNIPVNKSVGSFPTNFDAQLFIIDQGYKRGREYVIRPRNALPVTFIGDPWEK